MLASLHGRLFFALTILLAMTACNAPKSRISDRASSKSGSPSTASPGESYLALPDKMVDQGEIAYSGGIPREGIVLALSRWGSTLFVLLDVKAKKMVPLATKPADDLLVSLSGGKLAYLVRDGSNPAKNYIEILDLKRKKSQRINPAADFAILGFTLSPDGERLSDGEINLRWSRSHRVSWRAGLIDLKSGESNFPLTSQRNDPPGGAVPVPFAWSARAGKIYFRGLLPFRGMVGQGMWAISPDGSGLRSILSEPAYTGLPRLSPDGIYLAYLSTKLEALPRDYIPRSGVAPGNILSALNLLTGERKSLTAEPQGTFGVFGWSSTGNELLVSRQEWQAGRFRDAAFLGVTENRFRQLQETAAPPPFRVTGIGTCANDSFFWVEDDGRGARLIGASRQTLFSFPEGKMRFIGCWGE